MIWNLRLYGRDREAFRDSHSLPEMSAPCSISVITVRTIVQKEERVI